MQWNESTTDNTAVRRSVTREMSRYQRDTAVEGVRQAMLLAELALAATRKTGHAIRLVGQALRRGIQSHRNFGRSGVVRFD